MSAGSSIDFSRTGLEARGFRGFIAVRELRRLATRTWPIPNDEAGVYIALRPTDGPVHFRRTNPAGRWRGDPTLPLATLQARWVDASPIVYNGMADRPTRAIAEQPAASGERISPLRCRVERPTFRRVPDVAARGR